MFTASAAILVNTLVPLDATFGLKPETAQLIQSATHKPERNVIEHQDHYNRFVVRLENAPRMTIDVTSKITQIALGMNNAHPGQPFALAAFANWYPALTHGFPADEGYFIMTNPTTDSSKGDLYETKYTLLLWWKPDDGFAIVDDPSMAAVMEAAPAAAPVAVPELAGLTPAAAA
jgi:hypothetical protein